MVYSGNPTSAFGNLTTDKIIFCGVDSAAGGVSVAVGALSRSEPENPPVIFASFDRYPCPNAAEALADETAKILYGAGITARNVEYWVCVNGPGGFSGVRTGAAFVNGVTLVTDAIALPITTGEAMIAGLQTHAAFADCALISVLNAKRGETYFYADFTGVDELLSHRVACEKISDFLSRSTKNIVMAGHGAENLFAFLQDRSDPRLTARVKIAPEGAWYRAEHFAPYAIRHLQHRAASVIAPFYLREPDAVLPVS